MIGIWESYADIYLYVVGAVSLVAFGIPLLLVPLSWAHLFRWQVSQADPLTIFLGRSLGAMISILAALNRAFYNAADYTGVEVIGNVATKLYGMTPEFIKVFWQAHKEKNQVRHTEMVSPLNNRNFYVSASPFVGDKFVTSFIDITERKRVEECLRRNQQVLSLFIEHAPAAIAMLDNDMKYIAASGRYLEDYQLGKRNIVGHSHYEIFPEIPERWKEIYRRCLEGAIEKADEDPFPRADGWMALLLKRSTTFLPAVLRRRPARRVCYFQVFGFDH